jgi:hypothetical protein
MATPIQPAIDIGDLVAAMDSLGLQAIVDDVIEVVESRPDMTPSLLVDVLRSKKVSAANAHRVKSKLEASAKVSSKCDLRCCHRVASLCCG